MKTTIRFALATSVVFFTIGARAETGAEGAAAAPQQKGKSQGGGSSTGTVTDFSGSFSSGMGIQVPSFRGLEPHLSVGLGPGGSIGGVAAISRRSPGKGTPRFDASDIFLINGEELVPCAPSVGGASCSASGTHTTKIESYVRVVKDSPAAGQWSVSSRDGNKTVFACTYSVGATCTEYSPLFVQDLLGNRTDYSYFAAGQPPASQGDLQRVTYNGTTVDLYYEARPDTFLGGVGAGTFRVHGSRLKSVVVKVSGSLLRAYKVGYTTSSATGRSIVNSLQQCGRTASIAADGTITGNCAAASGTGMPPLSATATTQSSRWSSTATSWAMSTSQHMVNGRPAPQDGFTSSVTWNAAPPSWPHWVGAQCLALDLNGDGTTDAACHNFETHLWTIYITRQTGVMETYGPMAGPNPNPHGCNYDDGQPYHKPYLWTISNYCFPGDYDGDGKSDIYCWVGGNAPDPNRDWWTVTRWNGAALAASGAMAGPDPGDAVGCPIDGRDGAGRFCTVSDFDGDGRTDIGCNAGGAGWRVGRALGVPGVDFTAGFDVQAQTGPTRHWRYGVSQHCQNGDLNGDGIQDLWCFNAGNTASNFPNWSVGQWEVSLGYYTSATQWGLGWPQVWSRAVPGVAVGDYCKTGDLNGDGLMDSLCWAGTFWSVALSQSSSWAGNQNWGGMNPGWAGANGCVVGDLNGDRLSDIICNAYSDNVTDAVPGYWQAALSTGTTFGAVEQWANDFCGRDLYSACLVGDLNADGTVDIFRTFGTWVSVGGKAAHYMTVEGDYNGDGKTDVLTLSRNAGGAWADKAGVELSSGSGFGFNWWPSSTAAAMRAGGSYADYRVLAGDFNGDGKTDLATISRNSIVGSWNTAVSVDLSDGSSMSQAWWPTGTPQDMRVGGSNSDYQTFAADMNGDGKTDLVTISKNGLGAWQTHIKVDISTGSGFVSQWWDSNTPEHMRNGGPYWRYQIVPGDFNGDGRADLATVSPNGGGNWAVQVSVDLVNATANGFDSAWWESVLPESMRGGGAFLDYSVMPAELNGDGRTDLVGISRKGIGNWRTHLLADLSAGGASFWTQWWPSNTPIHITNGGPDKQYQFRIGDFNGDGKTDLVTISKNGGGAWDSWFSVDLANPSGDGLISDAWHTNTPGWMRLLGPNKDWLPLTGDFNGDGLSDLITLSPWVSNPTANLDKPQGQVPDLITTVTNGTGAMQVVEYTPSSAWVNTNNPPVSMTVTASTMHDGRGASYRATYSYQGGLYDRQERRALGFRYVKRQSPPLAAQTMFNGTVVQPAEAQGPYSETWYIQNYGAVSQIETQHAYSSAAKLLSAAVNEFVYNGGAIPFSGKQQSSWAYVYDGSGTACGTWPCVYGRRTYAWRDFDSYGAPTREIFYGDYDVSGDEVTMTQGYVNNLTEFVLSKPAWKRKHSGTSELVPQNLLEEGYIYYDGNAAWNTAPKTCGCTSAPCAAAPCGGMPTRGRRLTDYVANSYAETQTQFDGYGNVTAQIAADGAKKSYVYDSTYHLFAVESRLAPYNAVPADTRWKITFGFDAVCATPLSRTDMNGVSDYATYDALCRPSYYYPPRLTHTGQAPYEISTYVLTGDSNTSYAESKTVSGEADIPDSWGRIYTDGIGREFKTTHSGPTPGSVVTGRTYFNERGDPYMSCAPVDEAQAAPLCRKVILDSQSRKIRDVAFDNRFASYSYGFGTVTGTSTTGKSMQKWVDWRGLTTKLREWHDGTPLDVTFEYNERGYPKKVTDAAGNITTTTFNAIGLRSSVTDPDSGTVSYQYDSLGRVNAVVDPLNQRQEFTYDVAGRPTSKISRRANGSIEGTVTWGYDEARTGTFDGQPTTFYNVGRVTTMSDSSGTFTMNYDHLGKRIQHTRTIDGRAYTLEQGYSPVAHKWIWTQYPDGERVGSVSDPIQYDALGRMTRIPGYVDGMTYDPRGRVSQRNNANGTVTNYTYNDGYRRPIRILTKKGTTTLQDLNYTYDTEDTLTKVTSPFCKESWSYSHDDLNRLTAAVNLTDYNDNQGWSYDNTGNIASNSKLGTYLYDSAGGPTATPHGAGSLRPHAVVQAGSNSYSYDAKGQMSTGAGRTLTWNVDGKPLTINDSTFAYDGDMTRVKKQVGTLVTHYLGDDYQVEDPGGGGEVVTKHFGINEELVAKKQGSVKYWIHADVQGSVNVITDANGVEVQRMSAGPYGEAVVQKTAHAETRSYKGQRQDETGLFYFHARYYDPALGRFISPDPTTPRKTTVGFNRYAYAYNNPLQMKDTNGLGDGGEQSDRDANQGSAGENPNIYDGDRNAGFLPATGPEEDNSKHKGKGNQGPIGTYLRDQLGADLDDKTVKFLDKLGTIMNGNGQADKLKPLTGEQLVDAITKVAKTGAKVRVVVNSQGLPVYVYGVKRGFSLKGLIDGLINFGKALLNGNWKAWVILVIIVVVAVVTYGAAVAYLGPAMVAAYGGVVGAALAAGGNALFIIAAINMAGAFISSFLIGIVQGMSISKALVAGFKGAAGALVTTYLKAFLITLEIGPLLNSPSGVSGQNLGKSAGLNIFDPLVNGSTEFNFVSNALANMGTITDEIIAWGVHDPFMVIMDYIGLRALGSVLYGGFNFLTALGTTVMYQHVLSAAFRHNSFTTYTVHPLGTLSYAYSFGTTPFDMDREE